MPVGLNKVNYSFNYKAQVISMYIYNYHTHFAVELGLDQDPVSEPIESGKTGC